GFAHHQRAGGDVPRLQAGFEVGVGAAAGDVGQVERGRAGAAHVFGVEQQVVQALEVGAGAGAFARREAGDQHRAVQVLAVGDAHALFVELHAAAAAGGEQVVAQRIEDHAVGRLAVFAQRDRHAEMRDAVQVVAGAVERVDHPGVARLAERAVLFAEDGVVGRGAAEFLDDLGFGQAVD
ncbi:hypothetical protein CATMIT_01627, partial [Catenibacterium mitsuokai DSM 15897]